MLRSKFGGYDIEKVPASTSAHLNAADIGQSSRLLIVSSDPAVLKSIRERIGTRRYAVREAHSGADALEKLMDESSAVMVLDPRLADLDSVEFQSIVRLQFPEVETLTLRAESGYSQVDNAARTSFAREVSEALQRDTASTRVEAPIYVASSTRAAATPPKQWHGIIGDASSMQRVYHAARLVARRDTTVLIEGESGTGKDLIARAIHASSPREKQPFVVINCAAIPETLLEAELFGYTKGAFTGATQSRIGRVHAAHGGTLFLDEIGDMPYPLQSKILRFLEQGEVQRIGGTDTLKVDCRVIAATNAELKKLVKSSVFREDLYYRLAVFPIHLPPLRERMEDLDSLTDSFIAKFCPGARVDPAARRLLHAHDWPGNVRELRNVLERASLFAESRGEIQADDIVI